MQRSSSIGCAALVLAACAPFGVDARARADGDAEAPSLPRSRDAAAEIRDASGPDVEPTPYKAAVIADGPVAYFRFDDEPSGQGLYDDVTKRTLGTTKGAPVFGVPGFVDRGRAAKFGGNDCVLFADELGFVGNAPFTIEVWAQRTGAKSAAHIFTKQSRDSNKTGAALLWLGTGYLVERFVDGEDRKTPATTGTHPLHLAATYDGEKLTFFLNGEQSGAAADDRAAAPPTVPAIIGAAAPDGPGMFGFEGTLDDLAVFDRALPPERIAAHFAAR